MQKIYTKIESIVGNVITVRAEGVRNQDLAEITTYHKPGKELCERNQARQ